MIITISGMPGSGKSTLAKGLAKALGFKHYSTGDLWREMAKEKGISPLELNKRAEKNPQIDFDIDNSSEKLGKKEDNFVIDSRMAWHFIPKSRKIFVKVNLKEAAKRIFADMRPEEKENTSEKATFNQLKKRMQTEKKRYKALYNVDYLSPKNYNLILDSTKTSKEELLEKALEFVSKHANP